MNSKFATTLYQILYEVKGKVFAKVSLDKLASFPIPPVDNNFSLSIVELVKDINRIKSQNLDADISSITEKIDQLVYQLYGLTDEEIKIVEGGSK